MVNNIKKTEALIQLLHILWIGYRDVLGDGAKLITCHKMSANVYIFLLQAITHLEIYFNII